MLQKRAQSHDVHLVKSFGKLLFIEMRGNGILFSRIPKRGMFALLSDDLGCISGSGFVIRLDLVVLSEEYSSSNGF
jgi:hypothetical protein